MKISWPIYTAIANVNIPEVAEITVFDVTVVIERLKLYKQFAVNNSGVTIVAAINVGLSQKLMQQSMQLCREQAHLTFDEKDGPGDATVGMIGAADVTSRTSTDSAR